MNLIQLQEGFEAIRLKGNSVETVEKVVELANACQQGGPLVSRQRMNKFS